MREQQLYINGQWIPGEGLIEVHNPYNGTLVGTAAIGTPEQAGEAVTAATKAMKAGLAATTRAKILLEASRLLAERAETFARCISDEAGKAITAARGEVDRAVGTLRLAGEEARRLPGEVVPFEPMADGVEPLGFTVAHAVGVVAAITPFNFPLNLVVHKVGPALAAGCAIVLKPSRRTPLTAGLLAELLTDAGLPAGWLNLITGRADEIVPVWIEHPDVAVITFTGSAEVGWELKAASPRKRHILELGSNTALVVAADADLDRAVDAVVAGGYAFSGQACVSVQRVYVHEQIAQEFTARLAKAVDALPAGDPADPATVVGPLVSPQERDRVQQWIAEALDGGSSLAAGGVLDGNVLRPTVLTDVPRSARVVCEEVFGPVVSVCTVNSVREGIEEVNASRYGLNTAIFTSDLATALTFARTAEAGSVLINITPSFRSDHMPYGGVKESGQGREGVKYAIAELTEQRLIIFRP